MKRRITAIDPPRFHHGFDPCYNSDSLVHLHGKQTSGSFALPPLLSSTTICLDPAISRMEDTYNLSICRTVFHEGELANAAAGTSTARTIKPVVRPSEQ